MNKILILLLFSVCFSAFSQTVSDKLDTLFPIRGFCIGAPRPDGIDEFVKFIDEELAPRHVNTLILRVDYNYQYESRPELRDSIALSKRDVKKLVDVCKKNNIRIIPQINLLGHQSWHPLVELPEEYEWPNPDGLYCKSYCPLHPEVHDVVFDVVDEICDVFETDAFHAGMDEVFYIGEKQCPRCSGRDKAELFAGEVWTIRNHLAEKGRKLWIWGDRLIDGKTTGIGEWEGSYNNTWRAVDMIPKDVMICDWHYERPDQTPVYFAMKGLSVVTCPWRNPENAVLQAQDMVRFREHSSRVMKDRFMGMVQTVWSGTGQFLDSYYGRRTDGRTDTSVDCFKALFEEMNNPPNPPKGGL